jgi:hypothetical protein
VELAGRLDNPGQDQRLEHRVTVASTLESEHPIRRAEGIPQVTHPRQRDRQRAAHSRPAAIHAEIKFALPSRHPLRSGRLQHCQLGVVVRGADVLDVARASPRRVDDLDRSRPTLSSHCARTEPPAHPATRD